MMWQDITNRSSSRRALHAPANPACPSWMKGGFTFERVAGGEDADVARRDALMSGDLRLKSASARERGQGLGLADAAGFSRQARKLDLELGLELFKREAPMVFKVLCAPAKLGELLRRWLRGD